MSFLIQLIIWAIVTIVTYFMTAAQLKQAEDAADQTSNEVKLPRIKLGLPIPSGFGRFQVACVLIHFDKSCYVEHEQSMESKKGKYIRYTYSMWCRAAVSLGPIDSWEELICDSIIVKKDDDLTPKSECDHGNRGNILAYEIFMGTDTQVDTNEPPSPSGLSYRGIAYARLHICLGASVSPLVPRVTATRYVSTAVSGTTKIGDDANLVHVLYHILTDDNHIGLDPSLIDIGTFDAASQKLIQEGIGGSYVVQASHDLSKCVDEILDWIGGKLYRNEKGKICLKLIRLETPSITLTDSDITEITSLTIPTWFTVPCAMCLEWINPTRDYEPDWIYTFDPGVEDDVGMFKMQEFSFNIIASDEIAQKVLQQKATYLMYPKATIKFRTLKYLSPYSVFRIQSDRFGIEGTYRVTELVREFAEYSITAVEEPEIESASLVYHGDVAGSIVINFTSAAIDWLIVEVTASIWGGCAKDEGNPYLNRLNVTIPIGSSQYLMGAFRHCCLGTTAHDIGITGKDANYEILVNPGYTTYALEPPTTDKMWESGGLMVCVSSVKNKVINIHDACEFISIRDAYVDEGGYHLKGVIRGLRGSTERIHPAGSSVWLVFSKSSIHLPADFVEKTLTIEMVPEHVFYGSRVSDQDHAITTTFTYHGYEHEPGAITNLKANDQSDPALIPINIDIIFTWDLPTTGAEHSYLRFEIDGRVETLPAGATSYLYTTEEQVKDGVDRSTFVFSIAACNNVGCGPTVSITVNRLLPPGVIRNLKANDQRHPATIDADVDITFTWDLPTTGGPPAYIQLLINNDRVVTLPADATSYVYTVDEQVNDGVNKTKFDTSVRACNDAGCGQWVSITVNRPSPDAITNLKANGQSDPATIFANVDITFTWDLPTTGGAPTYIQLKTGGHVKTLPANATSYVYTVNEQVGEGLNTKSFDTFVCACNDSGCGPEAHITVNRPVPGAITNLKANGQIDPAKIDANVDITFTWDLPTDGVPITYVRFEVGGHVKTLSSDATSYVYTVSEQESDGLNAESFAAHVRACNESGCGPEASIDVYRKTPGEISNLKANGQSDPATIDANIDITFTWDYVFEDVATTYIRLEIDGHYKTLSSDARSYVYTVSEQESDGYNRSPFIASVSACNNAGCGLPSSIRVYRPVPGPITNFKANGQSDPATIDINSTITFTWDLPETGGSPTRVQLETHGHINELSADATSYTYTVSEQEDDNANDRAFDATVRACNSSGCGSAAAITINRPGAITNLRCNGQSDPATALFGRDLVFTWDPPSFDFESYAFWIRGPKGSDCCWGSILQKDVVSYTFTIEDQILYECQLEPEITFQIGPCQTYGALECPPWTFITVYRS